MFKKIILYVATLAVLAGAFIVYQMSDDGFKQTAQRPEDENRATPKEIEAAPTAQQGGGAVGGGEMEIFTSGGIPPGSSARISVYDNKGREKLQFGAAEWEWISDTEVEGENLDARVVLPGGQFVYVWADEGYVVLQRADGNNMDPKRGDLRGNVRIFIDRTTPKWRAENPDRAEPEQHPDQVVKIYMDELHFDLDLARLETDGPIHLQSLLGEIEGVGLELVWNEVTRQVTRLTIAKGQSARVAGSQLGGFDISTDVTEMDQTPDEQDSTPESAPEEPPAVAEASPDEEPNRLTFADAAAVERLPENRIDTYQVEFHGDVVAMQKQRTKVTRWLKADLLHMLVDLGAAERDQMEHPESKEEQSGTATAPVQDRSRSGPADTMLELKWSGKLTIAPSETEESRGADEPRRFHVTAVGSPVIIEDEQNRRTVCHELVYHDESSQLWLRGTDDEPVRTNIGANRELIGGREFTFDRETGVARISGAGRILDKAPAATNDLLADARDVELRWTDDVEITFDRVTHTLPATEPGGPPVQRTREYIRTAVFNGDAAFVQGSDAISADQLRATFRPPAEGELEATETLTSPELIEAIGDVHMATAKEDITCDELRAEMRLNDVGSPYPHIAHAIGNVVARQGEQMMHAGGGIDLTMASVPVPVTDQEKQRFEALAKEKDIESGSPEWVAFEKKLRDRRRIVVRTMLARDDVVVRDPASNLHIAANDSIECTLDDKREITRATILGSDGAPALVDTGDFLVRGARIMVDVPAETVDVPGDGELRFLTDQDLDGSELDEPVPVVVTWEQQMALRGSHNVATFGGAVRAESDNTTVSCNELRIDFRPEPPRPAPDRPVPSEGGHWLLRAVQYSLGDQPRQTLGSQAGADLQRKPVYIHAIGDASIESRVYRPLPRAGAIVSQYLAALADAIQSGPDSQLDRLVTRFRISGPKIGIDLVQEHLGVEGAGYLLIEDYDMPKRRPRSSSSDGPAMARLGVGALKAGGPSQTAFQWKASMMYLSNQDVATFDEDVTLRHVSGAKITLSDSEARSMNLDVDRLHRFPGMEVTMTCENLFVQFRRDATQGAEDLTSMAGATQLKSFKASGRAVRIEEGNRAAQGTLAEYDAESGIVSLTGSARTPAQVMQVDEFGRSVVTREELIQWDQKTGNIYVKKSNVTVGGN